VRSPGPPLFCEKLVLGLSPRPGPRPWEAWVVEEGRLEGDRGTEHRVVQGHECGLAQLSAAFR